MPTDFVSFFQSRKGRKSMLEVSIQVPLTIPAGPIVADLDRDYLRKTYSRLLDLAEQSGTDEDPLE